jgi:hypothetical protein
LRLLHRLECPGSDCAGKEGVPAVVVGTDEFLSLGKLESRSRGLPDLDFAITQHPIGGLRPPAVLAKAQALVAEVVKSLVAGGAA